MKVPSFVAYSSKNLNVALIPGRVTNICQVARVLSVVLLVHQDFPNYEIAKNPNDFPYRQMAQWEKTASRFPLFLIS